MTLAGQDYVRLISGFFHVNGHESIASPRMMKDNGVAVYSCQKSFNFLEL